jgi:hypothetical protein
MICAPRLVFDGAVCVMYRFHVLCSMTHFRRYQGRRDPFSRFACQDSFPEVPVASGPIFLFCSPELVFGGIEGVSSRFHVLRSRTHFRRYRGRRDPFSCFVLPDSFSAIPWASLPDFMFSAPRHVFGGTEGVGSLFHVLRSRTHFRLYRGRRVPFCVPGLIFDGTGGVVSRFLVLRARTLFQHFRGRRFPFSCFVRPYSFSAVQKASGPVFMFCAPVLICSGTEGIVSRFLVLLARTRFRRFRGCRVPFSCFARPDSFSAVPRASGHVFVFCVPVLIFGGIEDVVSRFLILCS